MKWYKILWFLGCGVLMSVALEADEGVLDTTFNAPDGYVLWDGGSGYDRARDIALQADGKIVVTGYKTNGVDNDLFALRYDLNGNLDTSFGVEGVYIYDGGMGDDTGMAIAIQSDGKMIAAGTVSHGTDSDVLVIRLDVNGIPDTDFGSDGMFIYSGGNGSDGAVDLQIQGDDSIVIAGYRHNGTDSDMLVIRLTKEGLLDTTFNTVGSVALDGGMGHDHGLRLALQLDQNIVVTGGSNNGSDYDILVARLDAFGLLDQTFGNNGMVRLDGGDYDRGYGLDLDSLGRILVTGIRAQPDKELTDYDIPVFRLDPNGILDTSFGDNGMALYDGGSREECYDLVVQKDDSILMAGHSGHSDMGTSDWDLVVLKYDPNGLLDTTFGVEGVYSYDPTANTEWGYGLALQTDGKIVIAGQAYNGTDDDVIVLRLENSLGDVNEPNPPGSGDDIFTDL
ncbi:delta-60 repeat domain-containing protein [Planctomycetota bacterium]